MPTQDELRLLLQIPNESLTVEYKSWLNLADNGDKARLAKAAIALANEGGGIIVFGMREPGNDGGSITAEPRPNQFPTYHQDDINAAVGRYADPAFHCELRFCQNPAAEVEHAFVLVPGGMQVPVMSKRACEGIIAAQKCYVRKPGPRSEEPFTAEEWRGVMERCVQNRRESMLDAIRVIVQGHGAPPIQSDALDKLSSFSHASFVRWRNLVDTLPQNDPARMPHGHYDLNFELVGVQPAPSLAEFRRRMEEAGRVRLTGWGPFVNLGSEPFQPRSVAGNIEAWIGALSENQAFRDSAHCDFWRANPTGLFYLLRGYDEDSVSNLTPGSIFDATMPIWRVGEAMLYMSRLSRLFDNDPNIIVVCRYEGLRGRRLDTVHGRRLFSRNRVSHDGEAELRTLATATQINDNLVEVLHSLLLPLYERFEFFELPVEMVQEELDRMRRK